MRKNQVLSKDFFERDTLIVAKELLGSVLVRRVDGREIKSIIVETEAYKQDDPACHAIKAELKGL